MERPQLQIGETEATKKILEHLASQGIAFQKLEHEPVTTSEAAAGARASRIEQGAKALIVKADDKYYHLIISAAKRVDNKKLRRLLTDGVIGEVRMLHADFGFRTPWDPDGRMLNPKLAGGALLDLGIYNLAVGRTRHAPHRQTIRPT